MSPNDVNFGGEKGTSPTPYDGHRVGVRVRVRFRARVRVRLGVGLGLV